MANIDINLTTECNMRCRFCGSWGYGRQRGFVDVEVARRALQAAASAGYSVATMTGGEPTLHPQFTAILRMARDMGFMTMVTTNGLRVSAAMIDTFRDCGTVVRVSLHTLDRSYHRELTGADTHVRVLGTIRTLAQAGVNLGIGCTVDEVNAREVGELSRFAYGSGAYYVRFSPVVGIRGATGTTLSESFYGELLAAVCGMVLANRSLVQHAKARMASQLRNQTTYMLTRACSAGSPLHIIHDCDGRLQPCSFLPEEVGLCTPAHGDPAAGIAASWARMQALQADLAGRLQGRCADCAYAASCVGGCLAPKVDHGLDFAQEQPVCTRYLVESLLASLIPQEQEFLMSYWAALYARKTAGQETPKNCIRHLPLWELNFRPGPRDPAAFVTVEVDQCVSC